MSTPHGQRKLHGRDRTPDELLDETLALVSHELRTPLTVIAGAGRVLRHHPAVSQHPDLQEVVDDLRIAAQRMARIVENMLLLSRLNGDPGEPEPVLVRQAVAEAVNAHRRDFSSAAVRVVGDRDPGLTVLATPSWLHLTLLNLLNNAHQYGNSGGTTVVEWFVEGSSVRISICNSGEPVGRDDYEQWFEPFYRASAAGGPPGAGLGLAVARRLTRAQNGDVIAEPWEAFPGTKVTVTLPLESDG